MTLARRKQRRKTRRTDESALSTACKQWEHHSAVLFALTCSRGWADHCLLFYVCAIVCISGSKMGTSVLGDVGFVKNNCRNAVFSDRRIA